MTLALQAQALAQSQTLGQHVIDEQVAALRQHMQHCHALRGRWFDAALLVERAHRVVAPRFVTTVVVATLLLAMTFGWF